MFTKGTAPNPGGYSFVFYAHYLYLILYYSHIRFIQYTHLASSTSSFTQWICLGRFSTGDKHHQPYQLHIILSKEDVSTSSFDNLTLHSILYFVNPTVVCALNINLQTELYLVVCNSLRQLSWYGYGYLHIGCAPSRQLLLFVVLFYSCLSL